MAGRRPTSWTIPLIVILLGAVAVLIWLVATRTATDVEEAVLTVPPVEMPDRTPTPPDLPEIPTPGPT